MTKSPSTIPFNPLLALLLIVGVLFILWNLFSNIPNFLLQLNTKVKTPEQFEFKSYDQILKKHVQHGLVDYESLKKDGGVEPALKELAETSPEKLKSPAAQLAYWVNAGNLLSIKLILDHYPMNKLAELGQDKGQRKFIVGGKQYSVDSLDEGELQALFMKEWRGIFLRCNGSLGAPKIADHAYIEETLDSDLREATRNFVTSRANFRITEKPITLWISPFYRWNKEIINTKYPSPFDLVNDYMPSNQQLDIGSMNRNYGLPYDWRINDLRFLRELEAELKAKEKEQ